MYAQVRPRPSARLLDRPGGKNPAVASVAIKETNKRRWRQRFDGQITTSWPREREAGLKYDVNGLIHWRHIFRYAIMAFCGRELKGLDEEVC